MLVSFTQDDIISLLYYFGYLTMKEYDEIHAKNLFAIPNEVIKEAYNNYF